MFRVIGVSRPEDTAGTRSRVRVHIWWIPGVVLWIVRRLIGRVTQVGVGVLRETT